MADAPRRHAEIAGAGFAGLTTAVSLRQRGWTVRVHEKAPEARAFGAGIMMWKNGLNVLKALGAYVDVERTSAAPPIYETRVHNVTMSLEVLDDVTFRTMTRQHLHGALLAAAQREGVDVVTSSEIVAADPAGTITLESGRTLKADLIVGADGVASKVRDSIGFKLERNRSQDGITRLLVPRLKDKLGPGEWDNVIDFWNFAPRVIRVLYVPCDESNLYLALMVPQDDARGSATPVDVAYWAEVFPNLYPVLEAAAQARGRYDGYQTTVLDRWTAGKVALVGDSAHAMCPALAQGAGCAMTNGFSLARAATEAADIVAALPQWAAMERPITDRCQARSAWFADTRSMSRGNQFTDEVLETARYRPAGL